MWLLHVRPNHVCGCDVERTVRTGRCRSEGVHERQHLSMRCVSEHRCGNSECPASHDKGRSRMKLFELSRADDPTQAIAAGAKATTAQQGANIRFIAGGTTLIDLMKLNVETPEKVVDVTHLPFDKIETLPGGGLKIGAFVRNS